MSSSKSLIIKGISNNPSKNSTSSQTKQSNKIKNQKKPYSNNNNNQIDQKFIKIESLEWFSSTISYDEWEGFMNDSSWYNHIPPLDIKDSYLITSTADIKKIEENITSNIQLIEQQKKNRHSILSGDEKWIQDVIKNGTLSDKVAALALKIQANNILELESLDILLSFAHRKEQRTAQLALEAIKDLLIHNLLPDRHLKPFELQPFLHPNLTRKAVILMWFEGQLFTRMKKVVDSLDIGMKSTIDHFKKSTMTIAKDLLVSKPEQEARLLAMIVNKLGDPSTKSSTYSIELLKSIIKLHPAMKSVITREIHQFIYRPNLNPKVIYIGIVFLSQIPLRKGDNELALNLVECYVGLFESVIKQQELQSKLLSVLLIGINRAFPFLRNKMSLTKHLDVLFRLVHNSTLSTATQALALISYIALAKTSEKSSEKVEEDSELLNRFYRALYATLNSDQIMTKSRNTIYLNLLYRSLKRDPSEQRVNAFLKKIFICCLQSSSPIAGGLLLLLSEVLKTREGLATKIFDEVLEIAKHKENDSGQILGSFDANKREPSFALASTVLEPWELVLLKDHFHPSVSVFAKSLGSHETNHCIQYESDPTVDLSLIAFLNRFSYKNPKKIESDDKETPRRMHRMVPTLDEVQVNSSKFLDLDVTSIHADKLFFHKYFHDRKNLQEIGKSKRRIKPDSHDDDSDSDFSNQDFEDDDGGDDLEDEIDAFADKLAEELMYKDEDVDIDDNSDDDDDDGNDSDEEIMSLGEAEELSDDNSSLGGQDVDDFDSIEESNALELGDFKKELHSSSKQDKKKKKRSGHDNHNDDDDDDDEYILSEYNPDEDDNIKSNSKRKKDANSINKSKKSKFGADFAAAEDYEEEMESILQQIQEAAKGTIYESQNTKKSNKNSEFDKNHHKIPKNKQFKK